MNRSRTIILLIVSILFSGCIVRPNYFSPYAAEADKAYSQYCIYTQMSADLDKYANATTNKNFARVQLEGSIAKAQRALQEGASQSQQLRSLYQQNQAQQQYTPAPQKYAAPSQQPASSYQSNSYSTKSTNKDMSW